MITLEVVLVTQMTKHWQLLLRHQHRDSHLRSLQFHFTKKNTQFPFDHLHLITFSHCKSKFVDLILEIFFVQNVHSSKSLNQYSLFSLKFHYFQFSSQHCRAFIKLISHSHYNCHRHFVGYCFLRTTVVYFD